MIQDYTWEDTSDDRIRIYTYVLHLLSAMSQETYLYHVDKGSQASHQVHGAGVSWKSSKMSSSFSIYLFFHLICLVLAYHGLPLPVQRFAKLAQCKNYLVPEPVCPSKLESQRSVPSKKHPRAQI